MARVVIDLMMSVNGYLTDISRRVDLLSLEPATDQFRDEVADVGALVCGRCLFDVSLRWNENRPTRAPIFVVTHAAPTDWPYADSPFTFVSDDTDAVPSALAQAKAAAGDRIVIIGSPNVAQQSLNAGLVDAIRISLAPYLDSSGTRCFDNLTDAFELDDRPQITRRGAVTELEYQVVKPAGG